MKDWRAGGIGVGGSPLVDNTSTKDLTGFLERRRLGGFKVQSFMSEMFRIEVFGVKFQA